MVYMRSVNRYTIAHPVPLQSLEHVLTKLAGSKCFLTLIFQIFIGRSTLKRSFMVVVNTELFYTPTLLLNY